MLSFPVSEVEQSATCASPQVEELLSRVDTMATAGRLEEAIEQLSGHPGPLYNHLLGQQKDAVPRMSAPFLAYTATVYLPYLEIDTSRVRRVR